MCGGQRTTCGVNSLLKPGGPQGPNLGHPAWWQVLFTTSSSRNIFFCVSRNWQRTSRKAPSLVNSILDETSVLVFPKELFHSTQVSKRHEQITGKRGLYVKNYHSPEKPSSCQDYESEFSNSTPSPDLFASTSKMQTHKVSFRESVSVLAAFFRQINLSNKDTEDFSSLSYWPGNLGRS